MKYRFLENIATADIAFEAWGKTLGELFKNCATALTAVMADPKTIKPVSSIEYKVLSIKLEDLLFDFLSELVFLKDKDQILFSTFKINIKKTLYPKPYTLNPNRYTLNADLRGEKIDPKRHKLRADIKAVTWHMFKLEKEKDNWKARVVLDI